MPLECVLLGRKEVKKLKWIYLIVVAVCAGGFYACAEQEPTPPAQPTQHTSAKSQNTKSPQKNLQNTPQKTSQANTQKSLIESKKQEHKKTPDSTKALESSTKKTSKPADTDSKYTQNMLENINGEQRKEEVEEDGHTYEAIITYKPDTKIKHGKETLYYLGGGVAQVAFYIDNKKEGLYQIFSQEGVLVYEAYYKNGLLHGLCRIFEVKSGKLKSEMNFANGAQEGEMRIYDTAGRLWHTLEYRGGKKNGTAKEFDDNGKVVREVLYSNDMEISNKAKF